MFIMDKISKDWIVLGISGCTNSGKTSVTSFLQKSFPGSIVVNQDKYFRPDDAEEHILIPELNHKNWERLESVNWDALMECVSKVLQTKPSSDSDTSLLIVEGHIIFNYRPLEKLCHKKYFFTLDDKEECFRRRSTRVYDPPDIPGYFEKCVWPMYLSNLEDLKGKYTDIIYVNGTDTIENMCEKVLLDLKNYFQSSRS